MSNMKIIQIYAKSEKVIIGLGEDNKLYHWNMNNGTWHPHGKWTPEEPEITKEEALEMIDEKQEEPLKKAKKTAKGVDKTE